MTEAARVLLEVTSALNDCGIPYYVGGSFASGVWGQPRQTNDADLVVLMTAEQIDCLVSHLEGQYLLSRAEMLAAVQDEGPFPSFQLLHAELLWKVDLFVRRQDAYFKTAFGRRQEIEVLDGLSLSCSPPEDVILQKLRWFELGNRVSDRQWNDIVQVLEVQLGRLDDAYLDQWAKHFGVHELLDLARTQIRRPRS